MEEGNAWVNVKKLTSTPKKSDPHGKDCSL
jgi:hypothetical protein